MRTERGRVVRADFTLTLADRSRGLLRWEQQVAGTPFARVLRQRRRRSGSRPIGAQTRVTIELRQRSAASSPHRRMDGAPSRGEHARRGAGRAGANQWLSRASMRWWGWGAEGPAARAAGARTRVPRRRRDRRAPLPAGRARPRCSIEPSRLEAATRAALAARSSAPSTSATITPSASCTQPARAIPTSCVCAPANRTAHPTRSSCPPEREQVRAVLELCARRSLAVVPFGGGTSVVGGVAPLRGEPCGRDLARPAAGWERSSGSTASR